MKGAAPEPPASSDVAAWIRQARCGSPSALGRLMDFCWDYLLLVANRELDPVLRAKANPSDLVQETHLEAVRDFAGFRGVTEPELLGWLRRMLLRNIHNLGRHYAGTAKRRVGREVSLDGAGSGERRGLTADHPSPSSQARRQELAEALTLALARLSDDHRQVIIWHHQDDLSFDEIGRRLGRSAGAVRKLWARAVLHLRELLTTP